METAYLLLIDRKSRDNTDFTDLPFRDLEELTKIAEAALKIPYVREVSISKKTREIMNGYPIWGDRIYEKKNQQITGSYTTEEQFKQDLQEKLQDDELFNELYQNKEEWKRFIESLKFRT